MCVAYPGTVIEVREKEHRAVVDFSGTRVEAQTMFLPVQPGDQVLVHAGFVLEVLRDSEAEAQKKVFQELSEITGDGSLYRDELAAKVPGTDDELPENGPDGIYAFYGVNEAERI